MIWGASLCGRRSCMAMERRAAEAKRQWEEDQEEEEEEEAVDEGKHQLPPESPPGSHRLRVVPFFILVILHSWHFTVCCIFVFN